MGMQDSIKMSEPVNRDVKQCYCFTQQALWQVLNEAFPLCPSLQPLQTPCALTGSFQCSLVCVAPVQENTTHCYLVVALTLQDKETFLMISNLISILNQKLNGISV